MITPAAANQPQPVRADIYKVIDKLLAEHSRTIRELVITQAGLDEAMDENEILRAQVQSLQERLSAQTTLDPERMTVEELAGTNGEVAHAD